MILQSRRDLREGRHQPSSIRHIFTKFSRQHLSHRYSGFLHSRGQRELRRNGCKRLGRQLFGGICFMLSYLGGQGGIIFHWCEKRSSLGEVAANTPACRGSWVVVAVGKEGGRAMLSWNRTIEGDGRRRVSSALPSTGLFHKLLLLPGCALIEYLPTYQPNYLMAHLHVAHRIMHLFYPGRESASRSLVFFSVFHHGTRTVKCWTTA